MQSKKKQLENLVEELLEPTPFEMVLLEYQKISGEWTVRVFIDHPDGVTLDHCQQVTHLLGDKLEEINLLEGEYRIEISSPGVDRPLVKVKDFQRFVENRVYVRMHAPIDGTKNFTGMLVSSTEDTILVNNEHDEKTYTLPIEGIAKATLKPILKFC